jgi:serine/threonine protein kinase
MPFVSAKQTADSQSALSKMLNSLHGQPGSYDKKAMYRFGKTLGAGTYGIVREADVENKKVAVKIILKKNVKGNEKMVYDELEMLQKLHHPHIVQFVDWFESRVCLGVALRGIRLTAARTSSTSSHNWLPEESCSTESAIRASSLRKMHRRRSDRC